MAEPKQDKRTTTGEVPIPKGFDDLMSDVRRDVVSWIPEGPGATIAGRVTATEALETDYGHVPVTVLDVNLGDPTVPLVRVAWMGTVLERAFSRHGIARGDDVALRLIGRREGGQGDQGYDDWRIVVRKGQLEHTGSGSEDGEEPF